MSFVMHSVRTPRTARYAQNRPVSPETRSIWFLLHGYQQLADDFIRSFAPIERPDVVFVAPEALSRSYVRGTDGQVGASWMTRVEREAEIADQIDYLDRVLSCVVPDDYAGRIGVLGFSQGVAAMTRWMRFGSIDPQVAVLYSGAPAREAVPDWGDGRSYHVVHESEPADWMKPYIKPFEAFLDTLPDEVHRFRYLGGHVVHPDALDYLKPLL